MKGRPLKRTVLLTMLCALACATAASAADKASTKVTIDAVFLGAGDTQWSGDIFSSRKVCKDDRKVLIFRARPGDDEQVGATRSYKGLSQPGYYWTFAKPGAAPRGNYYALVKPTDRCEGDRSGTLLGP
jgi:hypothetical protein